MKKLIVLALLSQISMGHSKTTIQEAIYDEQVLMAESILAPSVALMSLASYSKSNYHLAKGFIKEYEISKMKLYKMDKVTRDILVLKTELKAAEEKLFQLKAAKSSSSKIKAQSKIVEFSNSKFMAKKIEFGIMEISLSKTDRAMTAMSMHNYKVLMNNVKDLGPDTAKILNKSHIANRIAKTFIGVSALMGTHIAYTIVKNLLDGEVEIDESERELVQLVLEEAMVVLKEGSKIKSLEGFEHL